MRTKLFFLYFLARLYENTAVSISVSLCSRHDGVRVRVAQNLKVFGKKFLKSLQSTAVIMEYYIGQSPISFILDIAYA